MAEPFYTCCEDGMLSQVPPTDHSGLCPACKPVAPLIQGEIPAGSTLYYEGLPFVTRCAIPVEGTPEEIANLVIAIQDKDKYVASPRGVLASSEAQPFTFHWLVELRPAFESHPHFDATYYAGWMDGPLEPAKTRDPLAAARFARKEDAERVAAKLGHTLSCVWKAIEHGFANADASGVTVVRHETDSQQTPMGAHGIGSPCAKDGR